MRLSVILPACAVLLLSPACASAEPQVSTVLTSEPLASATALAQATTPTPAITLAPTETGPTRLSIWWPEPLAPLDNGDAVDILSEQISAFQMAQGNVEVELRWKNEADPGGILSTLATASPVAPGALPDLTLLRRSDLLTAARAGLIYPLEGKVPSAILGDLYSRALQLGQIDNALYGLPYALEIQHMAYHGEALSWTFEDILANETHFVFPVGSEADLNDLFFAQYLAAGGPPPSGGTLNLDQEALLNTLSFYEQAVNREIIDRGVLAYLSANDYLPELASGALSAGMIHSTDYLTLVTAGANISFGPIPTSTGALTSTLDGWMWVLTTPNADRQALAVRFLNWMLNADRQGTYTQTVHMFPSQRSALQRWGESPYNTFIRDVMANATLPLAESDGGSIARALQSAFTGVISGQLRAADAAQALINQFES